MSGRGSGRPRFWTILVAATLLALAAFGWTTPPATEPSTVPASFALECGYDVDPALGGAYYTHCDEQSRVAVYIEYRTGMIGEVCFGPGTHKLGTSTLVSFAYYAGWVC